MSKTSNFGYTDTADYPVNLYSIDWAGFGEDTESRLKTDELKLVNINAASDQPETVVQKSQTIKNIYSNSGIDPTLWSTNKQGIQVLIRTTEVLRTTDSDDSTYVVDTPIKWHTVGTIPTSALMTDDKVFESYLRHISGLLGPSTAPSERISKVRRGILDPRS